MELNEYFKFTTVRNPQDRKLSTFLFKKRANEFKTKIPKGDDNWFVQKVRRIDSECSNFKEYLKNIANLTKKEIVKLIGCLTETEIIC